MRAIQPILCEDVCNVFIFLHRILQSSYLNLVFSFSTVLLVEIPSQVLSTEENGGSSIGCGLSLVDSRDFAVLVPCSE